MAGPTAAEIDAFDKQAAASGITAADNAFSVQTGMSPYDVRYLRAFTAKQRLLVIIRCPKAGARYYHGLFQAKPMWMKQKSGDDGLVTIGGKAAMVSDYDLMSVYRLKASGEYDKIPFSGIDPNNPRSALRPEATHILRQANKGLLSRFQHGAQDDYSGGPGQDGKHFHPNVSTTDRFAAFDHGNIEYLADRGEAAAFYDRKGLAWPYTGDGKHMSYP